jgi:DNA-binding response OmpR family regulator
MMTSGISGSGADRRPFLWLRPESGPSHFDSHADQEERLQEGTARPLILMIEDNPADVDLVHEALREHQVDCETLVLPDGEKAIQYIARVDAGEARLPTLMVLDLNLPRRPGRDVLAAVRSSKVAASIPVIILSSSIAVRDVEAAAELGATDYFQKPLDLDEFMKVGARLKALL